MTFDPFWAVEHMTEKTPSAHRSALMKIGNQGLADAANEIAKRKGVSRKFSAKTSKQTLVDFLVKNTPLKPRKSAARRSTRRRPTSGGWT